MCVMYDLRRVPVVLSGFYTLDILSAGGRARELKEKGDFQMRPSFVKAEVSGVEFRRWPL